MCILNDIFSKNWPSSNFNFPIPDLTHGITIFRVVQKIQIANNYYNILTYF